MEIYFICFCLISPLFRSNSKGACTLVRMNSYEWIRTHLYEWIHTNWVITFMRMHVMTVKDMFCLRYFRFVLVCVNTAFLLSFRTNASEFIRTKSVLLLWMTMSIQTRIMLYLYELFIRMYNSIHDCMQWRIESFVWTPYKWYFSFVLVCAST